MPKTRTMGSKSQQTSPRLVVIEGKDKGKVIPLKGGTLVIGRSKGDVIVPLMGNATETPCCLVATMSVVNM